MSTLPAAHAARLLATARGVTVAAASASLRHVAAPARAPLAPIARRCLTGGGGGRPAAVERITRVASSWGAGLPATSAGPCRGLAAAAGSPPSPPSASPGGSGDESPAPPTPPPPATPAGRRAPAVVPVVSAVPDAKKDESDGAPPPAPPPDSDDDPIVDDDEDGDGADDEKSPPSPSAADGPTPLGPPEPDVGIPMEELTPARVVSELSRHIVGQDAAKRAMAVALRNRWRRLQLPPGLREEVQPKNILMIGPTGVGKSEIARRMAKLVDAPFCKAEATKFTEVGFYGRDCESVIKDLVDSALALVKARRRRRMRVRLAQLVEDRILEELVGRDTNETTVKQMRAILRQGGLENQEIDVDTSAPSRGGAGLGGGGGGPGAGGVPVVALGTGLGGSGGGGGGGAADMSDALTRFFSLGPGGGRKRKMKIKDARVVIEELEAEKLLTDGNLAKEAIEAVEEHGIVVIDEIDKVASPAGSRHGADASAEGVQRDLLPLIEGTTVTTKHGNVRTDHILFVAAGAFHSCRPSDLMAELQGRLPIRVELSGLTEADLYRILTEPEANLIVQAVEMLATEGVTLTLDEAAVREVAAVAAAVNGSVENIGARRLHTVMERLLEEVSFTAPDLKGESVTIGVDVVRERLGDMMKTQDLSKFIL